MNEAGIVDRLNSFGHLANVSQTPGNPVESEVPDEGVDPGAIDVLHQNVLLALSRFAVLVGLGDSGMVDLHPDFTFLRPLQPLKAVAELGQLFGVQKLDAENLAGGNFMSHMKLGHRSGKGVSLQAETFRDVETLRALGFEETRKPVENSHRAARLLKLLPVRTAIQPTNQV